MLNQSTTPCHADTPEPSGSTSGGNRYATRASRPVVRGASEGWPFANVAMEAWDAISVGGCVCRVQWRWEWPLRVIAYGLDGVVPGADGQGHESWPGSWLRAGERVTSREREIDGTIRRAYEMAVAGAGGHQPPMAGWMCAANGGFVGGFVEILPVSPAC